ncbi:hypothetical protein BX666DRAFT_37531 [Dichotomocladium elegans]|nr:hypothetical protein BX666DRAFT_37531 [Dichotomocladium elegans]
MVSVLSSWELLRCMLISGFCYFHHPILTTPVSNPGSGPPHLKLWLFILVDSMNISGKCSNKCITSRCKEQVSFCNACFLLKKALKYRQLLFQHSVIITYVACYHIQSAFKHW